MAPAEIPFEYLLGALESARGTAIAAPTRNLAVTGMITPTQEVSFPDESRGTLVARYRAQSTRRWTEWETEETDVDLNSMAFWLSMAVKGGVAGSLIETGVYKFTYTPTLTSDDLKSATLWWGDPGMQTFRSAYCMADELVIKADGTGTDGTKFGIKGRGRQETKVANPVVPALSTPMSIAPAYMDVWLEANNTNAFGTTSITGRVLSVEHTIPTEVKYKFGPAGVAAPAQDARTFRRVGRDKRMIETTIEMELLDTAQYDIFDTRNAQPVRLRVRHNTAALIGATQYGYLQIDQAGPLIDLEWGSYEDVNRTVKFTVPSMYDTTLASDFYVELQCGSNVV